VSQPPFAARSFRPTLETLEDRITPSANPGDLAHFQQLTAMHQQLHQILTTLPALEMDNLRRFAEWVTHTREQLAHDVQQFQDRIDFINTHHVPIPQLAPDELQEVKQLIGQAVQLIMQEQKVEQQVQQVVAAQIAQLQQFGAQVATLEQNVANEELAAAMFFTQQQRTFATDRQLAESFHTLAQQAFQDIQEAVMELRTGGQNS
jgi:hypothetical protein